MATGITIFLSAFLLFQVQFIIGKQLLPWFGGAPAVWSACLVFFQSALLAGYAYAHGLVRFCGVRRQVLVHSLLLGGACLWLGASALGDGVPLLPGAAHKPDPEAQPVPQLLAALLASVGLPFLVLSANAPLIQSWHARSGGALDRTYRLYALSNAGSLLGLVSYPFGIEAVFDLPQQAWLWTALFGLFALACARTGWRASRSPDATDVSPNTTATDAKPEPEAGAKAPGWATLLLWALLPGVASLMLAATTNQLCQDVAVVPFLWMLPLALYLVTFIISFDRPHWYSRGLIVPAVLATGGALYATRHTADMPVAVQLAVFGLFLLLFCLVAHGELARLRPGRAHLTLFYLVIATGGALGAAFVSLLAPAIFSDFWELHAGILAGWLVFAAAWMHDRGSTFFRGAPLHFVLLAAGLLFVVLAVLLRALPLPAVPDHRSVVLGFAALLAVNLAMAIALFAWPRAFAWWGGWSRLFIAAVCALAGAAGYSAWREDSANHIVVGRNFYGVLQLRLYLNDANDMVLQLRHGNINHGTQFRDETLRRTPTTYYGPLSGVGRAIDALRQRHPDTPLRIGVLGLGTGTLAAYGRPGDRMRFYEINPLVILLSQSDPPVFSFISDSPSEVTYALGDARLSLERELEAGQAQEYDLIALDVFSSDAIPVHLVTLEAFETYLAHLRAPHGILAVHTSNRFLDLEPVVAALARRLELHATIVEDPGSGAGANPSTWILLTRDTGSLETIEGPATRPPGPREVLFTDRYSNLFSILGR